MRSAFHIYGLPGNTPAMQKEADAAKLMAVRSTWAHQKQVETCQRRQIPVCSTLENPPGNDTCGAAWMVPEIVTTLLDTNSAEVEFNTCAFQSKLKERWFKPSKWAGRLEGLTELSRVCRCPNWVRHVPVVGKKETEAAGAYPEELAAEVAARAVKTWRRVLNLEWWRHLATARSAELSSLEKQRLDNDSRKVIEAADRPPVKQVPLSKPRASKAVEWRDIRDRQNSFAIGGMRNPAGSMTRLHQVRRQGAIIRQEWDKFIEKYPQARQVAADYKLALILKQKPDGTTKRRIVIDLRRSGGNARAEVPDRIVLPRATDVVDSARYMKAHEEEVPEVTRGGPFEEDAGFMLLDLKDAFCHFGLHPKELCHAVSPGLESGTGILWCAMLFGYTAAPLIMGRLSAAIARLVQSLVHPAEGQTQMYVDDLLLLLRGSRAHRESILALVIYTLTAFGVQLSLDKGERGIRCTWIGTTFELREGKIVLGTPRKLLEEVQGKLEEWAKAGMLSVREMRSVAGKLSWIAGITPRLRWAVAAIYAVITAVEKDEAAGQEHVRAAKRDKDRRPKTGLAHRKRLGTALPWLQAALKAPHLYLIREEELQEAETTWGMVTDASPRGLGGSAGSGSWWTPSRRSSRKSRPPSWGSSGTNRRARAPWRRSQSCGAYNGGDHECSRGRS